MKKPYLNVIPETRSVCDAFAGYNHNLRIGEGEFYDMGNLTSSLYPVLSPRAPRGIYARPASCGGIVSKEKLCYVDGGDLVIGTERIDMGLTGGQKRLISMGAYIIIMPDKKYINTVSTDDRGDIEKSFTTERSVTFSVSDINGESPIVIIGQDDSPLGVDNSYWIDTSKEPYILNVYTRSSGMWREYDTCCVRIDSEGIGEAFSVGDSIRIDGFASSFVCTDKVSVSGDALSSLPDKERYATVLDTGTDYILVSGFISAVITLLGDACKWFWENIGNLTSEEGGATCPTSLTQTSALTLSRRMPEMDFIIESGNRLWGCRYGKAQNGDTVNEIYASKLNDFRNWNDFRGISTDSWATSVGSDGPFTGAVTFGGYPLFFKENMLHKVYGDMPSQFGYTDIPCRGIAPGSHESVAIVNEVLYYHSRHGICAYDGALPVCVSEAFGNVRYRDGVGGSSGGKYYVSLSDISGEWHLFVYDTLRGLWHREDSTHAVCFAEYEGEMYYLDSYDGNIKAMSVGVGSSMEAAEVRFPWFCESGLIGTDLPDTKYISRLTVRMSLAVGTAVRFYIEYDSSGEFEACGAVMGSTLQSFGLPIRPRRCDHMRLRIEGEGDCRIYSITRAVSEGGRV